MNDLPRRVFALGSLPHNHKSVVGPSDAAHRTTTNASHVFWRRPVRLNGSGSGKRAQPEDSSGGCVQRLQIGH